MDESFDFLSERLRSGEKIICPDCGKDYVETDVQPVAKSHCFYCKSCGFSVNIDDSNVIVE